MKLPKKSIDWSYYNELFKDHFLAMSKTPQDKLYHAEGDVLTHIKMVATELLNHKRWNTLKEDEKYILFLSALLHDIGKPLVTKIEDGKITSKGHSLKGDILIRELLYKMNFNHLLREKICKIALFHQVPHHIFKYSHPEKKLKEMSCLINLELLSLFVEVDNLGRINNIKQQSLDDLELFREFAKEQNCYKQAFQFKNQTSRFEYFRKENRNPYYTAQENFKGEVIMMSGLPGVGKDYYIQNLNLPVVSLDSIRLRDNHSFKGSQGEVIAKAKEESKQYMRKGESFIFNATNTVRTLRSQWVDLFINYNYKVKIIYIETPFKTLLEQNKQREQIVPLKAYDKIFQKWQVPDITEAHVVEYIYT